MNTHTSTKMKCFILLFAAFVFVLTIDSVAAKSKIVKNSVLSEGKKRNYYLIVSETVTASKPAPLIVMLHGSGRDGRVLLEHWQELAEKENIIIAGPDAADSAGWNVPKDGPKFLHNLVEELKAKHPVNPKRVYLFGHSAGAIFGIFMSVVESRYFAASVVHAGAVKKDNYSFFKDAERKIPIAMFVGARDPLFPLPDVRQTRDALVAAGLPVELTEIPNHDHNYYARSKEINRSAWDFLKKHELTDDPYYQEHQFR